MNTQDIIAYEIPLENYTDMIDFSPGSLARKEIKGEFSEKRWEPFRKWFFKNFPPDKQNEISNQFYKELSVWNKKVTFVPWFITKYSKQYLNVLERKYFLENGKILNNVFPPQQPFKMNSNEIEINFKAFSKLIEDDTLIVTITEINELLKK